MHGNPPEPPEMSRTQLEDHYEDLLREAWAAHDAQLAAQPMWQLIVAEQSRARRLHPDDHAGHPEVTYSAQIATLRSEVDEVVAEAVFGGGRLMLAWELVQVAGVAAAWAQRILDTTDIDTDDLMQLIEEGTPE